jgi:acetoin utilization protein AcuC
VAGEGAGAVGRVALVWDDQLVAYDLGPGHPLAPVRVELTIDLIRRTGLVGGEVTEVRPGRFDEAELLRLHRPDFVEAVRRASGAPDVPLDPRFGLGPGDTPAFRGMHPTSMLVCAATKEAARQVWEGEADHAFNPAGGLHHSMPDRAAGFCVYNDPAIAIDWLLEHGAERVCYVDVDVHHGDGVEVMFADDPRVLTISLHESGRFLFPGTGFVDDVGGPGAVGSVANLPLHPGTTGDLWLAAFDEVVDPLIRAFDADVLVTQLGCDTHATDPLAHLSLTVDDMAAIYARLHRAGPRRARGEVDRHGRRRLRARDGGPARVDAGVRRDDGPEAAHRDPDGLARTRRRTDRGPPADELHRRPGAPVPGAAGRRQAGGRGGHRRLAVPHPAPSRGALNRRSPTSGLWRRSGRARCWALAFLPWEPRSRP